MDTPDTNLLKGIFPGSTDNGFEFTANMFKPLFEIQDECIDLVNLVNKLGQ